MKTMQADWYRGQKGQETNVNSAAPLTVWVTQAATDEFMGMSLICLLRRAWQ